MTYAAYQCHNTTEMLPTTRGQWSVLPDWAGLNLIVRVNIGLGGWTKFGLVFGQFGGFQNI